MLARSDDPGGTMSWLHPEPIDPNYVKFRDGWATWIISKRQYAGLRWAPWSAGGQWLGYKLDDWDFIDYGVVGPTSPLKHAYSFEPAPAGYTWHWTDSFVKDKLPGLWSAVNDKYAHVKTARPRSVWNPYDGSWREMRARPKSSPPEPKPKPNGAPGPHTEFIRRSQLLLAEYQAGRITDEIYKIRLLELTREYT